jgi:hypothetical protein
MKYEYGLAAAAVTAAVLMSVALGTALFFDVESNGYYPLDHDCSTVFVGNFSGKIVPDFCADDLELFCHTERGIPITVCVVAWLLVLYIGMKFKKGDYAWAGVVWLVAFIQLVMLSVGCGLVIDKLYTKMAECGLEEVHESIGASVWIQLAGIFIYAITTCIGAWMESKTQSTTGARLGAMAVSMVMIGLSIAAAVTDTGTVESPERNITVYPWKCLGEQCDDYCDSDSSLIAATCKANKGFSITLPILSALALVCVYRANKDNTKMMKLVALLGLLIFGVAMAMFSMSAQLMNSCDGFNHEDATTSNGASIWLVLGVALMSLPFTVIFWLNGMHPDWAQTHNYALVL